MVSHSLMLLYFAQKSCFKTIGMMSSRLFRLLNIFKKMIRSNLRLRKLLSNALPILPMLHLWQTSHKKLRNDTKKFLRKIYRLFPDAFFEVALQCQKNVKPKSLYKAGFSYVGYILCCAYKFIDNP